MQCPTCGAALPDDARFCGACGTDLAAPAPPVQPPVQPTAPMVAAPPPPPPAGQPAPPGFPPPSAAQTTGAPLQGPRKRNGLVIGIVIGTVVLLLLCCSLGVFAGVPAYTAYRAAKIAAQTSPSTQVPSGQGQTSPAPAQPEAANPAPAAPEATNPEPVTPTLTEATANALVVDYLGKAKGGQTAEAKALVTSKYTSRITKDYFDLAAKDLQQFEVVKVEQGQGGYLVFVKETWGSGVWTNWYLVVLKDGKLVINDTGTE